MHSITYSNENFREEYERIYRENMYFRNKNGGLTYQTILNYLKLENQDSNHSEEEKNEIFLKSEA